MYKQIGMFLLSCICFACSQTNDDDQLQKEEIVYGSLNDIEGNVYKTIEIADQVWMAENLRTKTNRNGSPINNLSDEKSWSVDTKGAYCWFHNDTESKSTQGALYNWYAVETDKICPDGWHIPNQEEWDHFVAYIYSKVTIDLYEEGWFYESNKEQLKGYRDEDSCFKTSEFNSIWVNYEKGVPYYANVTTNSCIWGTAEQTSGRSVKCIKDK